MTAIEWGFEQYNLSWGTAESIQQSRIQKHQLMITHITPILLKKFDLNILDECVECEAEDTLSPCLWECTIIKIF